MVFERQILIQIHDKINSTELCQRRLETNIQISHKYNLSLKISECATTAQNEVNR